MEAFQYPSRYTSKVLVTLLSTLLRVLMSLSNLPIPVSTVPASGSYGTGSLCNLTAVRMNCFYKLEEALVQYIPEYKDLMNICHQFDQSKITKCYRDGTKECPPMVTAELDAQYSKSQKAFQHLCDTHKESTCLHLNRTYHDYAKLCWKGLLDSVRNQIACQRFEAIVYGCQVCKLRVVEATGSPCYYLDYNFENGVAWVRANKDAACNATQVHNNLWISILLTIFSFVTILNGIL